MAYVTDTHSLIWHMTDDPRLSPAARRILSQEHVFVPCIVLFELLYLAEKKKIGADFGALLTMISSSSNFRIEPICAPIIEQSRRISRAMVADPWDRLIAATSLHLRLPLITRDRALGRVGLEVVW